MPAKVILLAVQGPLEGTKYRFDEQLLCMTGRAETCMLQLSGEAAAGVSRQHCMFDINPPFATLFDLESRNGTYVNGKKITGADHPEKIKSRELKSGDLIRIGGNVFEIKLYPAAKCCICGNELPDDPPEMPDTTRRIVCPDCLAQGRILPSATPHPSAKTVKFKVCRLCGAQIATPREHNGELICNECMGLQQRDPTQTFHMPELESRGGSMLIVKGYRAIKQLGRGGMGAVYLAENVDTLERVALKILLPEIADVEQCREDFIREANNLRELRHPNIVALQECAYNSGSLYLALEYCCEGNLREYLKRSGQTLAVPLALDLTCQILDGLEYAHNVRLEQVSFFDAQTYVVNGLVHRDIKPANIFLGRQDGALTAKISDFGLAKAFDMAGISGCTRTGDFSGTLGFIPKQQFLNYKYAKPEVDVWSAAATLYYMLTGKAPRSFGSNTLEVMNTFNEPHVPVREYNPFVPEKIARVIDLALDDHGEQLHFKSAAQLKFAIRDARK